MDMVNTEARETYWIAYKTASPSRGGGEGQESVRRRLEGLRMRNRCRRWVRPDGHGLSLHWNPGKASRRAPIEHMLTRASSFSFLRDRSGPHRNPRPSNRQTMSMQPIIGKHPCLPEEHPGRVRESSADADGQAQAQAQA